MQLIGRPRVASAYVWLTALVATIVFVQGGLFAAFYSEGESGFINAHQWVGEITGYVALVVLSPLAFVARFPRELRVGWWTLAWAILWNIQAQVFGSGIEFVRWFEIIHIPLAIFLVVSGLYLALRAQQARKAAEGNA